jgi:hypothetical protein
MSIQTGNVSSKETGLSKQKNNKFSRPQSVFFFFFYLLKITSNGILFCPEQTDAFVD